MNNNKTSRRVLFIQHASAFGGSAISLLYTLQGIRESEGESCELIVALAKWTVELNDFYTNNGFKVIKPDWIDTYEHTQAVSYNLLNPNSVIKELKQLYNIKKARRNTRKLVESIRPDIVHLNSVVLLASAIEIKAMGIPLVWHVREHSTNGLNSFRKNKIIKLLNTLANKVIFICNADKKSWGNPKNSIVVYNFVDFTKFNSSVKPNQLLSDSVDSFNILFLGGVNKIKGTLILIRALAILISKNPNSKIKLIFGGGKYQRPNYFIYNLASKILPKFGWGTYSQLVEQEIKKFNLESHIIRLSFIKDVSSLFVGSNVLVFPSTRPHFARPIIEAGAMSLPVIGSSLDGVTELIEDGVNGFLCPVNDYKYLADRLNILLNNPEISVNMGKSGLEKAKIKYDQQFNIKQIVNIYDGVLN